MRAITSILLVLFSNCVLAQSINLVKDIRTGSSSSNPKTFVYASQNKTYFFATDPVTFSTALYVTDGSSNGTILLVANVYTGTNAFDDEFNNDNFLVTNGKLLFWADANNSGRNQLWHSDGTPGGTYALTTYSSGSPSIRSLVVHNNELYFFATGTSPAGVYKSNFISGDAQRIISHPNFDDVSSRLYSHNGKLYRVVRNNLYEINGTQESLIYTLNPTGYCFTYFYFIAGKFVYNKVSCSTADPLYQSMESYNLQTGSTQTLSTDPGFGYNRQGASISSDYYYFYNLVPAKVSGPGSKTSFLRIFRTNGQSVEFVSTHKYDSNFVSFNGFKQSDAKLYYSLKFDPVNVPGQGFQYTSEIFELSANNSTKLFGMTDKVGGYTFKQKNYVVSNNKVYFIADSTTGKSKSNLKIATSPTQFKTVYSKNNSSLSFDVDFIGNLNSNKIVLGAQDDVFPGALGYELYSLDLTSTGISKTQSQDFEFYPNPAIDQISIVAEQYQGAEILDLQGRVLLFTESTSVDLSNLSMGSYILRVKLGANFAHKMILKK